MPTDPEGSKERLPGKAQPGMPMPRFAHIAHEPTFSNNNWNVNNVYGSVQTINNHNAITYVIHGDINSESDMIQRKISKGLKPRHVPQAVYDAQLDSGCMEGTRVKILRSIDDWIKDPTGQKIFWLTGWAGTGKSAIAWTVCSRASNDEEIMFGGSFFCSRSASWAAQRDVRSVIPTLAQLMARKSFPFAQALAVEIDRDPDVLFKQISVQVEKLISRPLLALKTSRVPILFVIDALDECGGQSNSSEMVDNAETHRIVSEMLQALFTVSSAEQKLPIKFLVTSRPETHIRDTHVSDAVFSKILRLHAVDKDQVTADILLYIRGQLLSTPRLRAQFTTDDAETLARLCDDLFIAAATALKHILGDGIDGAATRFGTLLNESRNGLSTQAVAPLDSMYALILQEAAVSHEHTDSGLPDMLTVLAGLLSARMMLSVVALAELLELPQAHVRAMLSRLDAVINVPADNDEPALRPLHASFVDYIFHRAPDGIRISQSLADETSARACLRLMAKRLYFNISQSRSSCEPNTGKTPESITFSLEYACTQWAYHLAGMAEPSLLDPVLDETISMQLLFWLEVMSVLGEVHRAAAMMFIAASTVRSADLSRLLRDANFFITGFHQPITRSAAHIYVSALAMTDAASLVYRTFAQRCTGLISVKLVGVEPYSGQFVMTCLGHEREVTSLMYSSDGRLIISGSLDGTVRMWNALSGEETIAPLLTGGKEVLSVCLAPSGGLVAAGTRSGHVFMWTIASGWSTPRQFLWNSQRVTFVGFSEDSSVLFSESSGRAVHMWSTITGGLLGVLHGSVSRDSLAPSADRIKTSTLGLSGSTCSATSPNGLYIASGSETGEIQIWDAERCKLPIEHQTSNGRATRKSAMSIQGAHIACYSRSQSISIWKHRSGWRQIRLPWQDAKNWYTMAISSDGHLIATSRWERGLQLREAATGEPIGNPLGGTINIEQLKFSSDSLFLASVSSNQTVCVWDVARRTMTAIRPLQLNEKPWAIDISCDELVIAAGVFQRSGQLSSPCVEIWKLGTIASQRKVVFEAAEDSNHLALSPDGSNIAFLSQSTRLAVGDIESGQIVFLLDHSCPSFTFSPDGRFIFGITDEGICLWKARGGKLCAALRSRTPHEAKVSFTSDGSSIVAFGTDETLQVWNTDAVRGIFPFGTDGAFKTLSTGTMEAEWLTGPSGELLVWIPAKYHPYLQIPPCTQQTADQRVVISAEPFNWHYGETWTSCWR